MDCTVTRIPYRQTHAFAKIALDYIDQSDPIKPFTVHSPSLKGVLESIEARKKFPTNRSVLVEELSKQYSKVPVHEKVERNISSLNAENTFTVTTAHQNNIFTGPLYFIYKIVHALRLADHLNNSFPQYHFVPVYYMGSEDADLEELNHIHFGSTDLVWDTKQSGAVGRMVVDKKLVEIISKMEGQLSIHPHGSEIISFLKKFYQEGVLIQDATFQFVHALFAEFGLVVLIPDNAVLKKQMHAIFLDELMNRSSSRIVEKTTLQLESAGYKVQARPREINLFYLKGDQRKRITENQGQWSTVGSSQNQNKGVENFSEDEIRAELQNFPERFSPNVILRGIFQELLLPGVAFIGGSGEMAYWLQLKDLFLHYHVPFPLLVLRNSYEIVENNLRKKISGLGFGAEDLFYPEQDLMNRLVERDGKNPVRLNGTLDEVRTLYDSVKQQAAAIDITLEKHVEALRSKTIHRLEELEKKMLRAERKKMSVQQGQVQFLKSRLFPGGGLQERHENFCYYYALWGREFIQKLYDTALTLEQEFTILQCTE